MINLIRNDFVPELANPSHGHPSGRTHRQLTGEADPDALEAALRSALDAMNAGQGAINAALTHMNTFDPANPNPLTAWRLAHDRSPEITLASFTAIVSMRRSSLPKQRPQSWRACVNLPRPSMRSQTFVKWQRVRIPPCNLSATRARSRSRPVFHEPSNGSLLEPKPLWIETTLRF